MMENYTNANLSIPSRDNLFSFVSEMKVKFHKILLHFWRQLTHFLGYKFSSNVYNKRLYGFLTTYLI